MKKEVKTNVMRILEKEKVDYEAHYYPHGKEAAKAVGAKSIEMIHVKDINKITGYIRGGCSPVGMKKQFVTTYHETAQNNPVIMVSGGKIGTQVECKPDELLKITKGQYADICKD